VFRALTLFFQDTTTSTAAVDMSINAANNRTFNPGPDRIVVMQIMANVMVKT
jgi:hypothetical protein